MEQITPHQQTNVYTYKSQSPQKNSITGCIKTLSFERDVEQDSFIIFEKKEMKPDKAQQHILNPVNIPQKAIDFKKTGNYFKQRGDYNKAISYYRSALELYPAYTDVYYNLGRLYQDQRNYPEAITNFEKLTSIDSQDIEAQTILGNLYQETKRFDKAKNIYQTVLESNKHYDLARRSLQALLLDEMFQSNPPEAEKQKNLIGRENLKKAFELIENYNNPQILEHLKGITYAIGEAKDEKNQENLAQYEHFKNRILISEKLRYAAPEVIAAYIIHESVHAGDKDSYTSIREEQDAFIELAKFWVQHNNKTQDPDLDIAGKLYTQNMKALEKKVANVYTQRNPQINLYSPGHGESTDAIDYQVSKGVDLMIQKMNVLSNSNVDNKRPPVKYKDYILETIQISDKAKDK